VNIIDIHPHVMSPDRVRYPYVELFDHVADYVHKRVVDTEEMLTAMDLAGVTQSVVVQSSMAYGYDNSYVADSTAGYPDRFKAVCTVNPLAADVDARLRYWIRERGMVGMRIFTSGGGMPKDPRWVIDPVTFAAWETVADLGIPLCFRTPPTAFAFLPQTLARFRSVPVILEYIYGPAENDAPPYPSADAFWALSDEPNVYLKLKTHNILEWSPDAETRRAFAARCVEVFGADRIAFGSNYPATEGPLSAIVEGAQRELAFLPQGDQEQIFSGTALKLYPALNARVTTAA
jgi:predicted TIM-barrel fold metal-dependent hydrolase